MYRLIFQNVDGHKISTEASTLEKIIDNMLSKDVDIACLSETNTNWKHPRSKYKMTKLRNQFWSRVKLITFETSTHYRTPNTNMEAQYHYQLLTSLSNYHFRGRQRILGTLVVYNYRRDKNHYVTIINVYIPYTHSQETDISTTITQQ